MTEVVLMGDALAPVTSAIGFLRGPLDVVADGLVTWRRAIHGTAQAGRLPGGLRDHALALEPLTGGVCPRELLVATAKPDWCVLVTNPAKPPPGAKVLTLDQTRRWAGNA